MKLEKRKLVIEIEKRTVDKRTGHISFQFRIGPFKKTMATTVGSALRRTLLSMTKTLAITSVCGNFNDGNCMREDLFELSLNLQRIHIKSSFFPYLGIGRIRKKGPAIITAQDLKLEEGLEIVNPYQYICSINEAYTLDMCVMINSPGTNQATEYLNPINPISFIKKDSLQTRQTEFDTMSDKVLNEFLNKNKFKGFIDGEVSTDSIDSKSRKLKKNIKFDNSTNNLKDSKIKLGTPQKLPFDIIIVDPIYSGLQSCGFEIVQTTNSSVLEYEDLIKRGVTDTDEFLRFVVISRGAIEPAIAVKAAVHELKETLSVFNALPHVFASEKNLLLSLENISELTRNTHIRESILKPYQLELIKKLDIKHLKLPIELELFLRREGFVSFNNLISIPLEFFKRIGLKEKEIQLIDRSLSLYGVSLNVGKNLKWESIPYSLPF